MTPPEAMNTRPVDSVLKKSQLQQVMKNEKLVVADIEKLTEVWRSSEGCRDSSK